MFLENFTEEEISRMFHDFQGCFQSVSWKFQENFQCVSKKFHIAWHSSQLPEQKEGLFFCKKVCFFVPEQRICFTVIYMLQNI